MNCYGRSYCDKFSKLFEKSENPFSSKYFSSKSQSVEFSTEFFLSEGNKIIWFVYVCINIYRDINVCVYTDINMLYINSTFWMVKQPPGETTVLRC